MLNILLNIFNNIAIEFIYQNTQILKISKGGRSDMRALPILRKISPHNTCGSVKVFPVGAARARNKDEKSKKEEIGLICVSIRRRLWHPYHELTRGALRVCIVYEEFRTKEILRILSFDEGVNEKKKKKKRIRR